MFPITLKGDDRLLPRPRENGKVTESPERQEDLVDEHDGFGTREEQRVGCPSNIALGLKCFSR